MWRGFLCWLTLYRELGIIDNTGVRKQKGSDSVVFLQYPPCSTCQKAKKWLDEHNIAYETRHIKEKKPIYRHFL